MKGYKMKKILVTALTVICLLSALTLPALAYSESTDAAQTEDAYENVAAEIYDQIIAHSGEILSALSFAASALIVIVYKKSFLPGVQKTLFALRKSSDGMDGEAKKQSDLLTTACAALEKKADAALASIEAMEERFACIEEGLSALEDGRRLDEQIKTVLTAEIDMLYELFMSAALPQYEKDRIGEKINLMKKTLSEVSNDEKGA